MGNVKNNKGTRDYHLYILYYYYYNYYHRTLRTMIIQMSMTLKYVFIAEMPKIQKYKKKTLTYT